VPTLQPGKLTAEAAAALAEPSYTLFHYPTPDDKTPNPRLGTRNWKVADGYRNEKGEPQARTLPTGEQEMVFEYELKEFKGVPYFLKFRKIYTLAPKDYHVGLRLEIERLPGGEKGKGQTRLQLSGPRGLPIEGEWYATTYRNAIVGWLDKKGTPRRQFEESATIGNKRGGEAVSRGENQFKYMVIATQFFASGVAVDDRADNSFEKGQKNPWAYVRATTELPFDKKQDPNLPYFDDITVRAASETLDLAPGEKVAHSYLLYNGPSKVRLLRLMEADRGKVDPALVDRYTDSLSLRTITDFRSDTWLGRFANFIYWTDLVIVFTNLMHLFLALIHAVISSWAWAIVVLTVCVRLMLFYPSRRQTAMSMKMMEVQKKLQPQFEVLYEKHKDDLHTYNREKTKLMMQNGVNPFAAMGGCLLLLAQMPIMMGLYFCLQESVFFRLESFVWVNNLAAPDMLFWWTETIPYISTPEDIGSFVYMGPFFNLLPILAVGLMLYQQAKMMPPSTDPQAEQQRMMMKMMMVMMAVFFYKVAAGLALYFIVSTLWGIIERQFIPKPEIKSDDPKAGGGATADAKPKTGSPNGKPAGSLSPTAAAAVAESQQKSKGFLGRLRDALQKKMEEMQKKADEQSKRQIRNDPNRSDDGGSSGQGEGGQGGNRRDRDKKKRRRK
jgi:YidC/Oxa1 family membrane protein insertase